MRKAPDVSTSNHGSSKPPPPWDPSLLPRWATPSPRGLLIVALVIADILVLLLIFMTLF